MRVDVISEHGYDESLLGLGLSHGLTGAVFGDPDGRVRFRPDMADKLMRLAGHLAWRDGGHNKFLETMVVWLDIDAPRYWWSQFDTYRVGVNKKSESTMHTLGQRQLDESDFEDDLFSDTLRTLNLAIALGGAELELKANLPESFLQRRIVCTNYKALRNIVLQRYRHKLPQWQKFCGALQMQLAHADFIFEEQKGLARLIGLRED